ncbi:MAG: BrnA antitoxin family protein [Plectolyngbya sp. WJT66-NPBG17]|jgi:hypothetical protein|nr:BrnA antitoxin family protein [Plectolyngbya sp. WJT66-NPBG17]
MKATEFDKRFDNSEDVIEFLDLSKASRPGLGKKSVRIDFPDRMINGIDQEAKRLGLDRQSLLEVWVEEKLKQSSEY